MVLADLGQKVAIALRKMTQATVIGALRRLALRRQAAGTAARSFALLGCFAGLARARHCGC